MTRTRRLWSGASYGAAFAGISVAILIGILAAAGSQDPSRALAALWNGSLGTPYAVFSATLVRATPLLLTGCAVALAFRAGALNIGAEGQLLVGAAAAAAATQLLAPVAGLATIPAGLFAGLLVGGGCAAVAAQLRLRFGVLGVISTILLNFVALHLVGWLVRGPLQEPLGIYPQSDLIPQVARLPLVLSGTRLHWGFAVAVAAALIVWMVLTRTAAGFRIRATGMSPSAAAVAGGIDTERTLARAMIWSGALAGLAGAIEVQGVTFALYENLSPGYGYTAIAVALLARLDPLLVIPSALFFGALEAGAAAMQRDAGVPAAVATVMEATLVLLLLAGERVRRRSLAPAP